MEDNQIAQKTGAGPNCGILLPNFELGRSCNRLLSLGLLRQLDAGGVQFGAYLTNIFGIDFGRQFVLKTFQRSCPLRNGFLGLAKLQINVAQVIVHRRIRVQMAACFDEASLGIGQLALAEIHPAQTVQVGAVIRLQIDGFLDELIGFIQPEVAVRQCVSQIVQRSGMLRVEGQHFAEGGFGLVVLLHALEHGAAHEKDALFVFVGGGEFFGLIQGLAHVLEAFALFVNLGRRQERLKITRAIHEPAEFAGGIIGLAQVAKHLGVLAGNYVLVGKLFQGGFGFALGAGQILRRAVGLDDLHGHHLGAVFEDGAHLFVGVQRLRVVAGSAVQIAQFFISAGALLLLFLGIDLARGVGQQTVHGSNGLIEFSFGLVELNFFLPRFQAVRVDFFGLVDGFVGFGVIALVAVNLGHAQGNQGIARGPGRQILVNLESFLDLVGEIKVFGQAAGQAVVVGRKSHGLAQDLGGVLIILLLFVGLRQDTQGAVVGILVGGSLEFFDGALGIAHVAVQHGEAGKRVFVIRFEGQRGVVRFLGVGCVAASAV